MQTVTVNEIGTLKVSKHVNLTANELVLLERMSVEIKTTNNDGTIDYECYFNNFYIELTVFCDTIMDIYIK